MGDVKAFVTKWCAGHDSGTLGPKIRADLESLLAAERAAATAACADLVQERKHRAQGARILAEQDDCFDFVVEKIVAEIRQWQSVEDEIRALPPTGTGLVVVSQESLAAALDIIDAAISESGNLSDGLTPDEADAIRPLRAALARGKGE